MDEHKEKMEDEILPEDYQKYENARHDAIKVLKKVAKARNYVSKRDAQLQENMAFYEGSPYLLAQYQENRPWIIQMTTPYASMAIDTRVASLAASDYIGKLQPYTAEDKDTVEALESVYKDEWERANINKLIDDSLLTAAVVRESYIHVILDTSKKRGGRPGEITAYQLDTTSVLIDPKARKFDDAKYVIVMGRITEDEAEEQYPDFARWFPESSSVMPTERGELYIENDYTTEQDGILTVFTMYEKEKDKIIKKVVVENMMVEEKILKGLKRIPIAQLRWKKAAQSAYGYGLMDDLLSLQKAITSIESAITNTAVAYSNPSMIVRKGSGINPKVVAKTNGAPGVVYVSDIPVSEAMQPVIPVKIDDKIVALKQGFENAIDKISGVTNPFMGSIGTAGNTATGSQLAVERSKLVENGVLGNLSEFVETLTLIFIDYIQSAFAGEVITNRKIAPSTGQMEFSNRFIPKEIKDIDFSFYIDLHTKTKYSKEREKESLMQLYQMERQYDSPIKLINELDILSNYDLSNSDELVVRYQTLAQQTTQNKTETILKLTQASQQYGVSPELLSAAIAEVIDGAKETPNLDQLMMTIQDTASQVEQQSAMAEKELQTQGIAPEYINQAKQMMQDNGQGANIDNLNMM